MPTTVNKSSMDNVLQAVLATVSQEMSFFYSPRVYTQHRNIIESLLLSNLVKLYPSSPEIIDQIAPFVRIAIIPVSNGFIQLPDGSGTDDAYRNILGAPMIFAKPDSSGECGAEIEPLTPTNFNLGILKSGCRLNPVNIMPQTEVAFRLKSTYDFPTYENPVGYFVGGNKIKVCPFNVTKVAVMYAKKESLVNYGYITQPDDTFLYDPTTTNETGFDSNAFEPIYNACMALYSAYASNPEMQNWAAVLREKGIL